METELKWYQKTVPAVLLGLFVPVIGLYFLWKSEAGKTAKIIVTVIAVFSLMSQFSKKDQAVSSSQTTAQTDQTYQSPEEREKTKQALLEKQRKELEADQNSGSVNFDANGNRTQKSGTESSAQNSQESEEVQSVIEKCSVVFVGEPSTQDVAKYMGQVLTLYGYEKSADNYNRLGSALVSVNKDGREEGKKMVSEIEILKFLIKTYTPRKKETLPNDIGMAYVLLLGS